MKGKTTAVLVVVLVLAFFVLLDSLEFPHGNKPATDLVYHPERRPASMIKTDFLIGRGPVVHEEIYAPRLPTGAELAGVIYQQRDVSSGIRGFGLAGWTFSFTPRNSYGSFVDYAAIAARPGAQEYYFSVRAEVTRELVLVRVWISRPTAMRVCANRTVLLPTRECDDGSRSEPLVAR